MIFKGTPHDFEENTCILIGEILCTACRKQNEELDDLTPRHTWTKSVLAISHG
jgi:hypothetical protein